MRVTIVLADANLAGGTRVIANYALQLTRRGHQVVVVTPPPAEPSLPQKFRSLLGGRGWPRPVGRRPSHFDGLDVDLRLLPEWRPVADSDLPDADVVIATWWSTADWVARLSPRKGVKAYFIQQYESNFGFPKADVDATWRSPLHKIVCAQWLADLARNRFGDPNALVCPNGIDTRFFHAHPRGKQPVPTVGMLYAINPAKGLDVSLAALEEVRRSVPDLRLIAFSSSPVQPEHPLPPYAEFILNPPQVELSRIYARCDVWLCGSRSEGFHLPPHEAMACRCPVVSTRVGGPTELVVDGVNGFLADVEDSPALARGLVDVLTRDEADWRRMSDAAYETAQGRSWEEAGADFEKALESVVGRAARQRDAG